jgi:toxin ParE1/3/4
MAAKVDWSEIALGDLESAVGYVGADYPERGIQFGDSLVEFAEALGTFPLMGRVVPEFRRKNVRELILPPYRIVYHVDDAESYVVIVRVWHSARGLPELPGNP